MNTGSIQLSSVIESDMLVIEQLARSLDLDLEDLSYHQFIAAKRSGKIIGFGRLRTYPECTEIATVGVIPEEQKSGVATLIINELIRTGPAEIFVTCVIPDFFNKFGFQLVKQYPSVLQKKVDFCISYDFKPEQVFVMRFDKNEPTS